MKTGLLRQKKRSRLFAAHAAIALLALAGAIGLQWLWKSPLPTGIESWQPYVAAVLISTTAWLLFTAWLHATLARHNSGHRVLLQAVSDLAICGVAIFILAHGHNSTFALSSVWPICPVLIALAAPSAILLLVSTLASGRNLAHAPTPSPSSIATLRLISLAILLAALLLLANR